MVGDFKSSFPDPVLEMHEDRFVVREDLIDVGTKARAGEFLIATCPSDTIVYVQPRCGFAGVSLTKLCRIYGKRLVLFMPSSKEVSDHQAWCIEHGCEYHFHRIAAMPNLNKIAEQWAKENGAFFVPLGLRHKLVTAMMVKTACELGEPDSFWTAFSTGVLNRALQIAWPDATANGVAVARMAGVPAPVCDRAAALLRRLDASTAAGVWAQAVMDISADGGEERAQS
jgi:hypothetical protein